MTLLAMFGAGGRVVVRHPWLIAGLYTVQLVLSAVVGGVIASALVGILAHTPVFDAAVDGDLVALMQVVREHGKLFAALAWMMVATALLYGVVTWYLTGGLIAVFAGERPASRAESLRRFGAGGAITFLPYARLWLLSLIPYALILAALILGLHSWRDDLFEQIAIGDVVSGAIFGALPALLLWIPVRAALDYARIELSNDPGLASWRAALRGFKLVFTRPIALLHMLVYLAVSLAIVTVYVTLTWNEPMYGVAGAISIFLIRQLVQSTRYLLHIMLIAGQIRLFRK